MVSDLNERFRKLLIEPVRHSRWQVALVGAVIVLLAIAYSGPLRTDMAIAFWEWIDPVAGIMAFFLSVVVLYNQARDRWENSLEKRLTVSFVNANDDTELARVENAYLSGESDIRQWAQQLGRQIFGGNLQLDMNWDDQSPPRIMRELCGSQDAFVKLYHVTLYVYFESNPAEQLNAFSKRRFKHSRVEGTADALPLRWIRCDATGTRQSDNDSPHNQEPAEQ